ncbi:hypothetical protein [Zoogloea sp.]|uniref:hypothetical protein n=1 Tax=Zoogloea sp. TaxID=49181 RepID=UPI00258887E6|nr:hypothetical protein [Zoogloea sp.]MDD2668759.1 hypothetical protein [Zoogloea sp.]
MSYTPNPPFEYIWGAPDFERFTRFLIAEFNSENLEALLYLQYLEMLDDAITEHHANYFWYRYIADQPGVPHASVNIPSVNIKAISDFTAFANNAPVRNSLMITIGLNLVDPFGRYQTQYGTPGALLHFTPPAQPMTRKGLLAAYNHCLMLQGKKAFHEDTPYKMPIRDPR